jgi:hypothetical protein
MVMRDTGQLRKGARGFSLVEVNLAILLVALGMLALFALFPSALREADTAITDTHTALFADYVLSGLEANASGMTNWNTWKDMAAFRPAVVASNTPGGIQVVQQAAPAATVIGPVSFAGNDLRYVLEIGGSDTATPQWRTASLWVWSGTYITVTNFKPKAEFFYTEFYYPGSMP